jgi:chorismate mutase
MRRTNQSVCSSNRRAAMAKEVAELREQEEKSSSDPDDDVTSR